MTAYTRSYNTLPLPLRSFPLVPMEASRRVMETPRQPYGEDLVVKRLGLLPKATKGRLAR